MDFQKKVSFAVEEGAIPSRKISDKNLEIIISQGVQVAIYLRNMEDGPNKKFAEFVVDLAEISKSLKLPFTTDDFTEWFKVSEINSQLFAKDKSKQNSSFQDLELAKRDIFISIKRNQIGKIRNKALIILWLLREYSVRHSDKVEKIIIKFMTNELGGLLKYELKNGIFNFPGLANGLTLRDKTILNTIKEYANMLTKELKNFSIKKLV